MCITHSSLQHRKNTSSKELGEPILKKTLPIIRQLEYLELGGVGEPLTARSLPKTIKLFRKLNPQLKISLFTNGTMLKNKATRGLVLENIDYLQISINERRVLEGNSRNPCFIKR